MVARGPSVLTYGVEAMQARVSYFVSIGVHLTDIGRMAINCPVLLTIDIENASKKLAYLESLGIPHDKVVRMLSLFPTILCYSLENNLKPTFEFFRDNLGVDLVFLSKNPQILGYSLEGRIKPRFAFVTSKGASLSLINLTMTTDQVFCKTLTVSLDEYREFKETYLKAH